MTPVPDPIPHGTLTGHASGCRSDATCPMTHENQRTCKQIDVLYRGDYRFRKQIDAGLTPAQILEAERAAEAEAKEARIAARIAAAQPKTPTKRVRRPSVTRATKGVLGPDGYVHGTGAGYRRCKDPIGCPAVDAGLQSCLVVGREIALESWRKRQGVKNEMKEGTR